MFIPFLYELRARGVKVGMHEVMALQEALGAGLIADADSLYRVGRAVMIKDEASFDAWDVAFAVHFKGVEAPLELHEALEQWLAHEAQGKAIDPAELAKLTGLTPDELMERFRKTLEEQKEQHDGGSRWIGTGGTSPFGHGGKHPTGMRVGGQSGGRSAVRVAQERRFRNYRKDRTLDIRDAQVALRRLRDLGHEGEEELHLDKTIDRTAANGGDIELAWERARRNRVKILLLMDTGGSMTPYAQMVDWLFSAAAQARQWKEFKALFFHNCPYGRLYTNYETGESRPMSEVLREHDPDTMLVMVGDACMAPWELTVSGWRIDGSEGRSSGVDCLRRLSSHFDRAVWLNPEHRRYWRHPTIELIGSLFPMYPLSIEGLEQAVKKLRTS